jgi:hypothetical protein
MNRFRPFVPIILTLAEWIIRLLIAPPDGPTCPPMA